MALCDEGASFADRSGAERQTDRAGAELELVRGLMLVARRWRARLDHRLRKIGQTSLLFSILQWADAPLTQTELAEKAGVDPPTLVRLIDQLERQGLARRTADSRDRRVKVIVITEAAKPVVEEGLEVASELRSKVLRNVAPEDLDTCIRVLQRIYRELERL